MRSVHDVAILGGGTAGSALALLLARAGLQTLVLDQGASCDWKIGEGLPPSAKRVLQHLDVWERFVASGEHLPSYGNRSAWGSPQLAELDFLFDPNGCGWHINRISFDRMLSEAALEQGVLRWDGIHLHDVVQEASGDWQLQVERSNAGMESVAAHFLVDATGRHSGLARLQGSKRLAYDRLISIAGLFVQQGPHDDQDGRTMLEAVPEGWWYTALLPGRKRVVAFMSDGHLQTTQNARVEERWLTLCQQTEHLNALLREGRYELMLSPRTFAANSARLDRAVGDGWLAVGDAAAAYDPLSSQGILMAIGTAIEASKAIRSYWQGKVEALAVYDGFLRAVFEEYLSERDAFYSMEQRWPESPFWRGRRG